MADISKGFLSPIFQSPPWKEHVREYIDLLFAVHRLRFPHKSVSWLSEVMHLFRMELSPAEYPLVLEFCRTCSSGHFTCLIWEWILKHKDVQFSEGGIRPFFNREDYALILDWVAREKNDDILLLLARTPPPAGMSPEEREAAAAIWETKLQHEEDPLWFTTVLALQNQLYLLVDDHEKKLKILQKCLPPLDWASIPLWSKRVVEHCRQYPEDEVRFRNHCLDCIWNGQTILQRRAGWLGITMVGGGESESRLLELIKARYRDGSPCHEIEWDVLSRWQPTDPAIRAELLAWWHTWDVPDFHSAFYPRWQALFSLEEDESRLVEALVEQGRKASFPITPDGWLPRSPQLQSYLSVVATDLMGQWLPNHHLKSPSVHQNHVWPLLFRLPVSGSRIIHFIQSTVDGELSYLSLFQINQSLRTSGLPADTPLRDICLTVDRSLARLEDCFPMFSADLRFKELDWLVMELLREYARREETSSDSAPGSAIDPGWVNFTLGSMTHKNHIAFNDIVIYVTDTWYETKPAGSMFIMNGLWSIAIKNLEKKLAAPDSQNHSSPALGLCLSALACLARHIYPSFSDVRSENTSPPPPISPRLWEMLSGLVQQTQDIPLFLMAGAVGNHLMRHAPFEQRRQWWNTLGNCPPHPSLLSPNLHHVIRRNCIFNHTASFLTNTASESPPGGVVDSVTAIRSLRTAFHLLPDAPSPARPIWPDIWEAVCKPWESEHDGMTMKTGWETGMGTAALAESLAERPASFAERLTSGMSPGHAIPESTLTTGSPIASSDLCR